ncbi:cupin domain-containing protein [Ensifer adhaerens]|uniref:cupin domain-containing protein n=1 Tax=Ensifer adhaerens TaxID=106592 RepID=UPI001C4E1E59|nr:cupin domain-containing protein [Ensifer adhaerens]MBW0366118.1 cupin domain-containing protein [Ensifer adhaerens]UCM19987.1 cupin domain-containing protein [Ensifer adhaerens]
MNIDDDDFEFVLSDVEMETLRRAAVDRNLAFEPDRRNYKAAELRTYGIVREAYNSDELRQVGVRADRVVTSFDWEAQRARDQLLVDAPFAGGIRKWQLPIDVCEWRAFISEFPPGTFVEPHVHPANTPEKPGGSLRTVLKGSLSYAGKIFGPGDWFFIPNGVPYSFRSDNELPTVVLYKYAFFAVAEGNRFSSPLDLHGYNERTRSEVA